MKEIPLTRGYVALVSDEDHARVVAAGPWQSQVCKNTVYAVRSPLRLHRFILEITDPRIHVDHADRNGLNNQRENLRTCTRSQNLGNSRKRSGSSKFKGVSWHKGAEKWRAQIASNGRKHYLGLFTDEAAAAAAYHAAARKHFGPFMRAIRKGK